MRKKFIFAIIISISGILFTFLILNNNTFYAKEDYNLYAFQVGAYSNIDNANEIKNKYNGIIYKDKGLYKVLVGLYKNTDVLNKMLVFFENNNINIYLNNIKVDKTIYNKIDIYEKLILSSNEEQVYLKANEGILNLYNEVKN